jgi:hypothetical protein
MSTIVNGALTMLKDHWFWGAVTLTCLIWYSTITIYVTIKGARDIRNMLRRLSDLQDQDPQHGSGHRPHSKSC